ncbi:phosphotransferase enzyme family protein [Chloroflexota bacterium]
MKTFESLTKQGQVRRLRALAFAAIKNYDLDVRAVQLVGVYTNTLFRVRTDQGHSYLLRICRPGWRSKTDLRSEVMWLQALQRDTDIGAPQPRSARTGEYLVMAQADGVPEPRRCMLMSWVPGAPLEKHLNEVNLYKLGVLFAQLHDYSAGFEPPPGFTRLKLDSIYVRGEEDSLLTESYLSQFSRRQGDVLRRTRELVDNAFQELYDDPTGLRVIHNDLWHGNVKIYHGRLFPLDFEDTIWGYPVQDIAMAIFDLMADVDAQRFEPLQRALRQGYESKAAWPERYDGQLDAFRAGRMLWVANYVAHYQSQYLHAHIEWLAPYFEYFLETGLIRRTA